MSETKPKTAKARSEKPKVKVTHVIEKDGNGNATIRSNITKPKESKAPPVEKTPKTEKATRPAKNGELSEEQHAILKALNDLGGKDVHSIDIAKHLHFDKKYPDAPTAPVRNAMDKLHGLHFVTFQKTGAKYSYSITDKGKEHLGKKEISPSPTTLQEPVKTATAPSMIQPTERLANPDIECYACHTFNPFGATHCKECGQVLRPLVPPPVTASV